MIIMMVSWKKASREVAKTCAAARPRVWTSTTVSQYQNLGLCETNN